MPSTVSRTAKVVEKAVRAFHKRLLRNRYRFLICDGAGALQRVVLVALGITLEGTKEVIDVCIA